MSINNALSNANSGLSVSGRMAEIAANNIANALNDDYTAKSAELVSSVTAGRGSGVEVANVKRAVDPNILKNLRIAEGELANVAIAADAARDIADAIGGPDDPGSLFAAYEGLESALKAAADTPESQAYQQRVVDGAVAIADKFNQISSKATTLRTNADAEIERQVNELNSNLSQIDALNREIELATVAGRDVSALLDQRQTLIDRVSQIIPIKEVNARNGRVQILTESGIFLVDSSAKTVSFDAAGEVRQDQTYENGALSGLFVDGSEITPGSGGVLAVEGGSISALFKVRDETAPAFATEADALAQDLIERFQTAELAPGGVGLFTDAGAAFAPGAEQGLASRIAVNAAVDPSVGGEVRRIRDGLDSATPGPAGSDDTIRALLDAFRGQRAAPTGSGVSGSLSAIDQAAAYTSLKTTALVSIEAVETTARTRAENRSDAERSVSGVDTDRELQQLLLIEQAYAANARVIETVDRLIQRLLEI